MAPKKVAHSHFCFRGETKKQDILKTGPTGAQLPSKHQKMSIRWVPGCGSTVPPNAVAGGLDQGAQLYVARASHAGNWVPGKFHPTYKNVYVRWAPFFQFSMWQSLFVASYGGEEYAKGSGYDILTGEGFQWKAAENGRVPQGAVQVKNLMPGVKTGGDRLSSGRARIGWDSSLCGSGKG